MWHRYAGTHHPLFVRVPMSTFCQCVAKASQQQQTKAQLISVDQLQEGDQVGYGGDWQANKAMRVGTVNIGYGDGYNRLLSNRAYVSIHHQVVKVLGRVSMDMICIDLSAIEQAKIGDEVVLWGNGNVSVDQVAKQAQTIAYELLCGLNQRVERQYHG